LFLDELVELPTDVQPKLLRALDLGEVHPLSEDMPSQVDVRVVAATQENVWEKLKVGEFRHDLFQRIAGVVIRLPPLKDRPEDILPIARHFASAHGLDLHIATEPVLLCYSWPGNARELRQVIERSRALVTDRVISAAALLRAIQLGIPDTSSEAVPIASRLREQDTLRTSLLRTLSSHEWSPTRAAAALRIHRATLFRHLKQCGLSIRALRKSQ
jgi:DNA-binding NtrC family response regulator